MPDKALAWLGSARSDVRRFPAAARRLAGFQLRRVQQGLDPNDWKPMSSVGAGVREIRLHVGGAHRVFYVATFAEAVYVLHAFEKKTRKTTTGISKSGASGSARSWRRGARTMTQRNDVRVTESSGNVFRDVGFPRDEAEHLLVRADLLIQLQKALKARGLTQSKAAKLLGVTQPRVSDLLRGRIDLFSTDTLIDMLARVGIGVRVVLKPLRPRSAA